jgi:two-component system chemotaxis response regulator CheY
MVDCLLIESNTAERKRLAMLMTDLGFNCAERAVTEEGILYCREQTPAVVMMEASASPSTCEFLRSIGERRHGAKPIIILYSESPDVANVVQSIHEGAAEFLARPFDRDLLKFKLEQAGALKH